MKFKVDLIIGDLVMKNVTITNDSSLLPNNFMRIKNCAPFILTEDGEHLSHGDIICLQKEQKASVSIKHNKNKNLKSLWQDWTSDHAVCKQLACG